MNQILNNYRKTRKVLMVDDELINRELLEAILAINYDVTAAASGMDAMRILHAAEEPFSLILLDIIMPIMSGFDVIKACKEDEKLKDIPIIVMTSEKSAEVRSIRMGADDFIAKPYRMPEVILARCERIIAQSEERALIRSIEKDAVSGLYVKLFFDAYLSQMLPGFKGKMDAIALRIDGLDRIDSRETRDDIMHRIGACVRMYILGLKGIACRADENQILAVCRHREDHGELFRQLDDVLAYHSDITVRSGVCQNVDKSLEPEQWFEAAAALCDH